MKDIEDHAHAKYVLLSSDAMRHFINHSKNELNRILYLDRVINAAKAKFPSEDGWLVLNLGRMQELCLEVKNEVTKNTVMASPEKKEAIAKELDSKVSGLGSLAEAILTGNTSAALMMTESRPMVALADATFDLDAILRTKRGVMVLDVPVSEMLKREAERYSIEDLERIVKALTSAIDGTHTDEKSAVKTAILKAISVAQK